MNFDYTNLNIFSTYINDIIIAFKIISIFVIFILFKKYIINSLISFFNKKIVSSFVNFKKDSLNILRYPLALLLLLFCVYLSLDILHFNNDFFTKVLSSLFIGVIFYILFCFVDLFSFAIEALCLKVFVDLYKEIARLSVKFIKIFIIFIAFVGILNHWGINVTAILASLGIGGLALALAAKDTIANFLGGLILLTDKSLKVGDWVKIGDNEGVVEDIGLRSTKIRTFEKSLINIPNQTLSNEAVQNYSRRKSRRISFKIGLVYSTSQEQMQNILNDIKNMVKEHKQIKQNALQLINFDEFGDSALLIRIYIFTTTYNWQEYLNISEDINLKIMQIVQKNKSSFAFPSTSLYIEQTSANINIKK